MAKAEEIMDVNQGTVEATMRRFGVHTLLHGHTHRPNVHRFELDGEPATRIVLGDWYTAGQRRALGRERISAGITAALVPRCSDS
jgi:UDP-2,3-diacylglucosamine pyrophosphatase LpxH